MHSDVLEHVPEPAHALAEAFRVLDHGGTMLMTCPFFASRDENFRRAILHADGRIEHLVEPEIHGDPMNPYGALAYHHFGWQLLEEIRKAGFATAEVGSGTTSSAASSPTITRILGYGNMLPIIIRATK